jgi:hypothetical protein
MCGCQALLDELQAEACASVQFCSLTAQQSAPHQTSDMARMALGS